MHSLIKEKDRERAKKLIEKMSLKEKIGQLNQRLYGFRCYEITNGAINLTQEFMDEVEQWSGLGALYGLFRADPWSNRYFKNGLYGQNIFKAYNLVQEYVLEHSRLKIPVMMCSESPHGHQALDGYLLPVNLAVGCTFNPALAYRASRAVGKDLKHCGIDLGLVSLLDILRDPRWGRSEECLSEDPFLASKMAESIVQGIQEQGVGVVAKHFCGQGETTGGLNGSAARIGDRELYEIHLPAAQACCSVGVTGIMAAYNEIDGVFCHANPALLKRILRDEFDFKGIVMADGGGIDRLDLISGDSVHSAAMALEAGVDLGLWDIAFSKLEEAVHKDLIKESLVDQSVERVLSIKYSLGLFDKPFLNLTGERCSTKQQIRTIGNIKEKINNNAPDLEASIKLSEESPVLLKNDGTLPIENRYKSLAVIGPNADDIYRQIGDYSPEVKCEDYCTILSGVQKEFHDAKIDFCDGKSIDRAIEMGSNADCIILVLGGSSSRFNSSKFYDNGEAVIDANMEMDCGEGVDSAKIELAGFQYTLSNELYKLGKPIITVIIAGRPYVLKNIPEQSNALLYCFYPGPWGGEGISGILSGRITPSGRLSASIPSHVGALPVYYNQKYSRRVFHYADCSNGCAYPFGSGIGFSEIKYSEFKLSRSPKGEYTLKAYAKNYGDREDWSILQCYRRILQGKYVPRVKELIGFNKEKVLPGETIEVTVNLGKRINRIYCGNGKYENGNGRFRITVMDNNEIKWETELDLSPILHTRSE